MKFISWNVNGLRACEGKGFSEIFRQLDADFFCLQETKMQAGQLDLQYEGYQSYWNYADKKGYSGTAIFTKHQPLNVTYGLGIDEHDHEGRVITIEMDTFYLVTVYTPNSQDGLKRLEYRMKWEDDFRRYLLMLDKKKPVIVCGDLNVAHKEIDLKNPKTNRKNAGFTDEERSKFTTLLESGFTDSFRYFYPDMENIYSWWSYRFSARAKNAGWRIDYFVVSNRLTDSLAGAKIHTDIMGNLKLNNIKRLCQNTNPSIQDLKNSILTQPLLYHCPNKAHPLNPVLVLDVRGRGIYMNVFLYRQRPHARQHERQRNVFVAESVGRTDAYREHKVVSFCLYEDETKQSVAAEIFLFKIL